MKNRYIVDWDRYAETARRAAAEGAVLLENKENVLPLKEGCRVSVFGRMQFHYVKSGTGSGGMVNTRYVIGIPEALKKEEIVWDRELEQVYLDWLEEHPFDKGKGWAQEPWNQEEMPLTDEIVAAAAARSDTALIIIGRTAGEDRDAGNTPGSYLLTETEEDMLSRVCAAFSKVAVVLNVGNIIDMSWVEKYHPQAVLYTWQGGMEGGHSVADVLMGRVNPCGRLADTIALSIHDYPSDANFGGENGNVYAEDIYVGYRYFETFAKDRVQYPFGYGLSYTEFERKLISSQHSTEGSSFTVRVRNTGRAAGKDAVLLFVSAPQGKLGKPARALAAFGKTGLLQPGEEQELILQADDYGISSYDDAGVTGYRSCYVLEPGTYTFYLGGDVRSAEAVYSFEVEETIVTSRCTEALAPVTGFERMRPAAEGDSFRVSYEETPLRSYSMRERMLGSQPEEIPYTGSRGLVLADVYDGKASMKEFIAQMTDEDLCCIVRGEGMCSPRVTPGTASAFGGVSDGLEKLGIPAACCSDGPSGIRMDCGTEAFAMPNGTCLACSFNEQLLEELYRIAGSELRRNQIEVLLGPGMNIHRHPLNGRNFEYFSEDPLVTGRMAAVQLRGMQDYGVTGAIKHFAANNQEYHRRFYNSVISERALREIYLKGFEIAVREGSAMAVMSTYGAVNGLWTAGNYDLLVTILRDEWGFDGVVMTDWWAEINVEGETKADRQNLAAMVQACNDLYMVVQNPQKNSNGDNLEESLQNGSLGRGSLQRCAENILRTLMRLPVMDRYLDRFSEEEKEAAQLAKEESGTDSSMVIYPMDGDTFTLSGEGMDTSMGSSVQFGVTAGKIGRYGIRLRMKADAGELAQIPISVFANNTLKGTITINGTNGQWVEKFMPLDYLIGSTYYIRLYFAQSGIELDTVSLEYMGMEGGIFD